MRPPLQKTWYVPAPLPPAASFSLGAYPPIFRQILFNRKILEGAQAERFLRAARPAGTEPENLKGMSAAVERLNFALSNQERIAIYGDYDADGVTATALLTELLEQHGADVIGYIPDRFEEGYGLNQDALLMLHQAGIDLVITVDCGIRSPAEAAYAAGLGMDMIITDHHHPGSELPPAVAVINPKQAGDEYPEKELAGVGLAYKLAAGLVGVDQADLYLDLVALGTVADLAPLTGENRSLVRAGVNQLRRPHHQGVYSLIGVCGLVPAKITAGHIGFMLGPRLNAAGRLESAMDALNLLRSKDPKISGELAQKLDNQNRRRQQITEEIQQAAEQMVLAEEPEALLLFAAHPDFNSGVVGLAASRLTDLYYRPAIVGQVGEEYTRASCRSIPEFHITNALDQCADLLERHGGHAAAAGFTVHNSRLEELKQRLATIAQEQLSEQELQPELRADVEIPLSELKPDLLPFLEQLQPTGFGNRGAAFISRDLRVRSSRTVGRDQSHLKLTVSDGKITYDAIAFRQGHWKDNLPPVIDLLYRFETNEFNGRVTLQLNVQDLRPSDQGY